MITQRVSRWINTAAVALGAFVVGSLISAFIANSNTPLGGFGNEDGSYGGEFTLSSTEGPVSLSDYQGQFVVVYFGFLGCSNYCDTSMAVLQNAFERLDAAKSEQVKALFISIDPYRDDVEQIQAYVQKWHPRITGLTGSEQEILDVTRRYGAFFERTADEAGDVDDYEYLHTSRFFIIDRDGQLKDAMRHSTTPNELAARLDRLLEG